MRIVFCNIAWMHEYRGNMDGSDQPINGGSYVNKTGDAHEKYNFLPVKGIDDDEAYCLGFFETKSHNKINSNQFRIENIQGYELYETEEAVEDVLTVYCAKHPAHNFTTVVGWYNHATLYRYYQNMKFDNDYIQYFNAIAKASDCVLLPTSARSRKTQWEVPRKTNGWAFGFGSSNVWYASEDNDRLRGYLKRITSQIENYDGENCIKGFD